MVLPDVGCDVQYSLPTGRETELWVSSVYSNRFDEGQQKKKRKYFTLDNVGFLLFHFVDIIRQTRLDTKKKKMMTFGGKSPFGVVSLVCCCPPPSVLLPDDMLRSDLWGCDSSVILWSCISTSNTGANSPLQDDSTHWNYMASHTQLHLTVFVFLTFLIGLSGMMSRPPAAANSLLQPLTLPGASILQWRTNDLRSFNATLQLYPSITLRLLTSSTSILQSLLCLSSFIWIPVSNHLALQCSVLGCQRAHNREHSCASAVEHISVKPVSINVVFTVCV